MKFPFAHYQPYSRYTILYRMPGNFGREEDRCLIKTGDKTSLD